MLGLFLVPEDCSYNTTGSNKMYEPSSGWIQSMTRCETPEHNNLHTSLREGSEDFITNNFNRHYHYEEYKASISEFTPTKEQVINWIKMLTSQCSSCWFNCLLHPFYKSIAMLLFFQENTLCKIYLNFKLTELEIASVDCIMQIYWWCITMQLL